MAFDLGGFKKRQKEKEAEFMSHVSEDVKQRLKDPAQIDYEEWEAFCGNSYERKLLVPMLDDNALIKQIEYYLKNSQITRLRDFELSSHYDEAIIRELLFILIERLKGKLNG